MAKHHHYYYYDHPQHRMVSPTGDERSEIPLLVVACDGDLTVCMYIVYIAILMVSAVIIIIVGDCWAPIKSRSICFIKTQVCWGFGKQSNNIYLVLYHLLKSVGGLGSSQSGSISYLLSIFFQPLYLVLKSSR